MISKMNVKVFSMQTKSQEVTRPAIKPPGLDVWCLHLGHKADLMTDATVLSTMGRERRKRIALNVHSVHKFHLQRNNALHVLQEKQLHLQQQVENKAGHQLTC